MIDLDGGNAPVEQDYAHPERHLKLAPCAAGFPEEYKQAGWQIGQEPHNYSPRVKIMYVSRNRGLWSLGTKWLICDQPTELECGNDYMTWKFLHDHADPDFPVVKEMRRLTDPADPIQMTLISRAQGKLIGSIWHTLSLKQKSMYRAQLVDILKKLRRFTAPFPQKVNGDQLDDSVLCVCAPNPPTCFKIGFTDDEWLEEMSDQLRGGLSAIHKTKDPKVIEEKLQEIKDDFPRGGPYVLTHGDLNGENIIVKDGKIEAIIDWEMSGYYPWWAERITSTHHGLHAHDLFDGVWARIHPDLADDAFAVTLKKLEALRKAVAACSTCHVSTGPSFWRPPFCKCRPYGGQIMANALGRKDEHVKGFWRDGPKALKRP